MTDPASSRLQKELAKHPALSRKEWYRTIYLLSPHWIDLREKAKLQHGESCTTCGSKRRLDVHHLNYRNIYDVSVEDLQVLCRRCHDAVHDTPKEKKPGAKKRKKKRANRGRGATLPDGVMSYLSSGSKWAYKKFKDRAPKCGDKAARNWLINKMLLCLGKGQRERDGDLLLSLKSGKGAREAKKRVLASNPNTGFYD